jgi:hypothetical protein
MDLRSIMKRSSLKGLFYSLVRPRTVQCAGRPIICTGRGYRNFVDEQDVRLTELRKSKCLHDDVRRSDG